MHDTYKRLRTSTKTVYLDCIDCVEFPGIAMVLAELQVHDYASIRACDSRAEGEVRLAE